ncbi:NAD-binding protein [Novosphingobium sp.]|uniref:NAD-binding protein n=1 Tax=Novosphingobium sp. TaxID=1874826 RepID=UPI003D6D441B
MGEGRSAVIIAAVALTFAVAPNLATAGRVLAGRLRRRATSRSQAELVPHEVVEPVLIVGLDERGRTIADALNSFGIGYSAIEDDPQRLREAVADGYHVMFRSLGDPRFWGPAAMAGRQLSILTMPSLDQSTGLTPMARRFFPDLTRIAVVGGSVEAEEFAAVGLSPVIDNAIPPGLDAASAVLDRLGIGAEDIENWAARQRRRVEQPAQMLATA